jgi:hypothetical protein
MSAAWYYCHENSVHGPITTEELKARAARKLLLPDDWVWPEGGSRPDGVPARAALDFSQLAPPAAAGKSPSSAALPAPGLADGAPEWLEDLRLWVALDGAAGGGSPTAASTHEGTKGDVPEWVQSWWSLQQAEPRPASKPAADASVAGPAQQLPAAATAPQVGSAPGPVAKMIDESGMDLETGRIIDPERFRQWMRRHAVAVAAAESVSNVSLMQAFRQARVAIEKWVDDDRNHTRIMKDHLDAIERSPAVAAILQEYARYGAEMRQKLLHHLAFLVENRRSYYKAMAARRR